ncbi:hypothetical protein WCLP8_3850002 [uncultured Gammaproteobacteria bacterium]
MPTKRNQSSDPSPTATALASNAHEEPSASNAKPYQARAGWNINDWCFQCSISHAWFYVLKAKGLVATAKVFSKTVVLTDPREFLESYREVVA